jgi:hypothetical protein
MSSLLFLGGKELALTQTQEREEYFLNFLTTLKL